MHGLNRTLPRRTHTRRKRLNIGKGCAVHTRASTCTLFMLFDSRCQPSGRNNDVHMLTFGLRVRRGDICSSHGSPTAPCCSALAYIVLAAQSVSILDATNNLVTARNKFALSWRWWMPYLCHMGAQGRRSAFSPPTSLHAIHLAITHLSISSTSRARPSPSRLA